MKNPNLGRNQKENNGMHGKSQSRETKNLISKKQSLRYRAINQLLYKLREDQLNKRIREICKELLTEYSTPIINTCEIK